jgi:intergrase/recombinase
MTKMKKKFKKVAFFCTKGGTSSKNTFETMKELCGKKPVAVLDVTERDIRSGEFYEKAKRFAVKVRGGV